MANVDDLVGKTIVAAELGPYDKRLILVFTDDTTLTVASPKKPYAVELDITLKENYNV